MKKSYGSAEPALRLEVNLGENIQFTRDTTSNLPSGSYIYDLKINTIGGDTSTFVNGERFDLLEDIDHGRN